MPFKRQRSITDTAWRATMAGASNMGAVIPLNAAASVAVSSGIERVSAAGDSPRHCDGAVGASRGGATLAGRREANDGDEMVATVDLQGCRPVLSWAADTGAAAPGFKGHMRGGVALSTASSVMVCGGIVLERSIERPSATSLPAGGDNPPQCDSYLGTYMSESAPGRAEQPVETTTVPTVEPVLGDGTLVVHCGGSSGDGMESSWWGATTTVTAECNNPRLLASSAGKKRIAPNEEHAMTIAIRTWESRKHDPIFFPYEGTKFNSFEEAKEFYNLYSWEVGFGVKISRGRKNDNGYVTKKDLCCSCRHCLKVLVHLEVTRIPPGNILHRWTKAATNDESRVTEDEHASQAARTADYTLKQLLLKRVLAASGVDTRVSEAAAASAISALEKLTRLKANSEGSDNVKIGAEKGTSSETIPQACPERPQRRGRPKNTSLKSYQSKKRARSNQASETSTTDEENPRSGKTRALDEFI